MAHLTYNVFSGYLSVVPERAGPNRQIFTIFGVLSGRSNHSWDERIRQVGEHGTPAHVHGGPIPIGRWKVAIPGAPHPDGGRLRPGWIPIGPVSGRSHIYIHCENLTEGCINVPRAQRIQFDRLVTLLREEQGGWITVDGGGLV